MLGMGLLYQLNDKNIDGTETYGTINITSEDKTLNETIENIKEYIFKIINK